MSPLGSTPVMSTRHVKDVVAPGTELEGQTTQHECLLIRNSPKDQAILETEFERNQKPDKAARMEIVSRVTLGEKEVQVSISEAR